MRKANLRGEFPEGFNIHAVGGISLHSTAANVVNVPGDISYSAPVGGDASLYANTVDIHSQSDVNIWSANNGVFNVANDLILESIIGNGDFKIQSYLNTNIDAIHGIEIGSAFRELLISAPAGIAQLSTDIISFSSGDADEVRDTSFFLLSNNTIDIRATKTFFIDSFSINFTSIEDTTITSDVHNVEIETPNALNVSASANIILKTVSNTEFETLLGDFTASSNGVVSLYAHGSFFYAQSVFFSSDNLIRLDSAGSIKFTDTTSTSINSDIINLNAFPGEVAWTSTTGNIDITVDELNVFSDNIDFTTAHVPGASFSILTQAQVSFVTSDVDIHFESTYTDLQSQGNVEYFAISDIFMVAVRHASQANLVSPDGFSSYTADKEFSIEANDINLQANGGILFEDLTSINVHADKTLYIFSHNLFYQSSTLLVNWFSNTANVDAGHDVTYTANVINSNWNTGNHYATGELEVSAEPTKESIISINATSLNLYSTEGGAYFDANTINVATSRRIDFINDYEDNQEFNVNAGFDILFLGGEIEFISGTSNNLLAPTGGIYTTSAHQTQFSGNEGVFKSITGSLNFNDGTFSAQGDTINFRGGEKVQWHSEGYTVDMEATSLIFDSGVDIELFSNILDLATDHNTNFNADDTISVLSQGDLPFTAQDSIYVQGGEVTFGSVVDTIINAETVEFSSGNSHDINVAVTNDIVNNALGDISFNAGNRLYQLNGYYYDVALGDLTFTSNNDGEIQFNNYLSSMSVNNGGNTNFASDFLDMYAKNGFYTQLTGDYTLNADYAEINSGNNVYFQAGADISITGVNMDTTLAPFQFDVSTYNIQGSNNWTSCSGDVRLNVGTYVYSSTGSVPIYQQVDPCQTKTCGSACQPGNFEIVSRSNRTQTINTNYIPFVGDKTININGGALLFQTYDQPNFGSINFTTDNGVTFASKNYPNHLIDAGNDILTASGNLNVTIKGAAHFVADGFDNNFAYPNYGILMETTYSDLYSKNTNYTIKVPNGQINENAAKVIRIATLQPLDNTAATLTPETANNFLGQPQDLTVAVTRDVLFSANLGAITTISGGQLIDDDDSGTIEDDDEYEDFSSLNFRAVVGDITARANLAQMIFNAEYLFSATSATDSITFTSNLDQTHASQRKDGDLLYHSEFGNMYFTDKLDTSIIAGSPTQDASIDATASAQIYVTSGQSQVYSQTGANADPSAVAINIIGDEGGILVQTPSQLGFYSSARVEVSADTGILTLDITGDIDYLADGRIDYVSQLTSNFTVSDGNIDVNAFGGGGSVSISSDDGQDINGQAGQGISVTADADNSIYAIAGITALSHTGDISLNNGGVNQDMFFLSQGSVKIQAADVAGVSVYGYSFHADAFQDVLFDSNYFTIASSSDTTTATEPIIEIHAGGDTTNEGIVVNSVGQMQWTTGKASGVNIIGDKISFEAGVDVRMTTNGPILFENKKEENEGTFTITTTTGTITVNGNENAGIVGVTEAQFNTEQSITLQSIGTDAANGVQILSRRDLEINANDFDMTTVILEGEISDFQVKADDLISIQNTVGDEGTLLIQSDLSLDLASVGPILLTSSGPTTISTFGKAASINFDSQGDQTLSSGDSTFFNAVHMDTNAPEGIDFISRGGAIGLTASDDITFIANETLTVIGRSSLEITTDQIDSTFLVSSTGVASFIATNDLSIDSSSGKVIVTADKGIEIDNRVPTKPRDQGDIFIQSYGELSFTSGDDATYSVGRYYAVTVDDDSRLTAYGDVSFDATHTGASISLIAEAGSFIVESGEDLSFTAGNNTFASALTVTATQDLNWEQTYEEGFGGITITSTGSTAPFTISSGGTTSFESVNSIQGTSPQGYISFFSDNFMSIGSHNSEGDIVFNSLNGNVEIDAGAAFIYGPNNSVDEYRVIIESFASQNPTDINYALYVESTGDIIQFQTQHHQSIITTSGGHIFFATADLPNNNITSTSGGATNIVANGISADKEYGIYVETDNAIRFDAGSGIITAHSELGKGYFNASENYDIYSNDRINIHAGDDFLIFTGFTPEPNANLPNRTSISITTNQEVLFSSNYNDVIFQSEDASWTVTNAMYLRSSSVGGHFQFISDNEPMQIIAQTANFAPTELVIQSASTIAITAQSILFSAKEDLHLVAPSSQFTTDSNFVITSDQGDITFLSPRGVVNFQPNGILTTNQHLVIPRLQQQAGISQINRNYPWYVQEPIFPTGQYPGPSGILEIDKFELEVENEYPGCQERAFGFDEFSETMCICDFNKWRCAETWSINYANALYNNYFVQSVSNDLSDPLFY